jgi:hypothetical protein
MTGVVEDRQQRYGSGAKQLPGDSASNEAKQCANDESADYVGAMMNADVGAANADDAGDTEPNTTKSFAVPCREHRGSEGSGTGVPAGERRRHWPAYLEAVFAVGGRPCALEQSLNALVNYEAFGADQDRKEEDLVMPTLGEASTQTDGMPDHTELADMARGSEQLVGNGIAA